MALVCPLCPPELSSRLQFNKTDYLKHIQLFHVHQPNFHIACGISGSERSFRKFQRAGSKRVTENSTACQQLLSLNENHFGCICFPPNGFVVFLTLFKKLFTFSSRYLFTIGLMPIFSFRWSLPRAWGEEPTKRAGKDLESWRETGEKLNEKAEEKELEKKRRAEQREAAKKRKAEAGSWKGEAYLHLPLYWGK